MAVSIASRVAGVSKDKGSGVTTASQATGTITPVSGELMLVWVASTRAGASNTPTMTGTNGLNGTWTAVATIQDSGNTQKLTLFRGVATSGVAGVLTIAFAAQSQLTVTWVVVSYPNVNQTTNQGVVQSITGTANAATAKSVTLGSAPGNNANVVAGGAFSSANTTFAAASGYTAVDTQAGANGTLGVEGTSPATLPPNTTATETFGASGVVNAIAVEIRSLTALDIRPTGSGTKPGTATACIAQSGSRRFREVISTGGDFRGRPANGSPGPAGYPVGDPTGRNATTTPTMSTAVRPYWPFLSQRDDATGNPTPAQRQINKGLLAGWLAKCVVGLNTWAIDVRFEAGNGPYPRLIAKADPTLGLYADAIATAVAPTSIDTRTGIDGSTQGFRRGGYAWQTLSVSFTLSAAGVVELWREKRSDGMDMVWWDNARSG